MPRGLARPSSKPSVLRTGKPRPARSSKPPELTVSASTHPKPGCLGSAWDALPGISGASRWARTAHRCMTSSPSHQSWPRGPARRAPTRPTQRLWTQAPTCPPLRGSPYPRLLPALSHFPACPHLCKGEQLVCCSCPRPPRTRGGKQTDRPWRAPWPHPSFPCPSTALARLTPVGESPLSSLSSEERGRESPCLPGALD